MGSVDMEKRIAELERRVQELERVAAESQAIAGQRSLREVPPLVKVPYVTASPGRRETYAVGSEG